MINNIFGLGVSSTKRKDSKKELEKADKLNHDALAGADRALLSSSGVPGTADALAYEPIQGLVAISTSDGKIKLFGRPGCETTLYSAAKYPYATRQLQFLQNRGVLVRVSKGGFMECWSVVSGGPSDGGVRALGTVKVRGDKICCVADMARDPYVLLGCSSGSLRIAMLVDGTNNPTTHPRHARAFVLAPYRVRPKELCGNGEVRQLAVQSFGPVHRALVLFTSGIVSIWDLRATELVTSIDPTSADPSTALAAAGEATAVCWIGTVHGDFASGHVDGSVLVWALPGLEPGQAEVAAVMRVVAAAAEPIRMLRCVFGEAHGLLVLGGQEVEQPEALTWLALPTTADDEEEEEEEVPEEFSGEGEEEGVEGSRNRRSRRRRDGRRRNDTQPLKLPWFGHLIGFCLVVDGGSGSGYEAPAGVLQLVEGGQLVLYNLQEQHPVMVGPFFQQKSNITVTEAPMVPVRRPANSSPNTLSLAALRKLAAEQAEAHDDDQTGMAAFHSGVPPTPPPDATWGLVYCTGYKDGSVCVWDLNGGTTRLLCSAPAGDALEEVRSGSSSGSVTCLSLVWPTGLLLAGHHKGEVRMYQFSPAARHAECVTLDSINSPGRTVGLHQPAGLQLRLRVQVNSGEITSLAYCQAIRSVAAGDKAGGVALIDTAKPAVRWYAMPSQQAVLGCALAPLPLPPSRVRAHEVVGEEGMPCHTVVIADSEGKLAALDAGRGCFMGRNGELSPKNHSYTLCLELLDEDFNPLWAGRQLGAGCDQAALVSGAGPSSASLAHRTSHGRSPGRSAEDTEEEEESAAPSARGHGRAAAAARRGHRGRGRDEDEESAEEDEDAEELDDVDVDTLLAKAAMQVEKPRSRRPRNRSGSGAASAEAGSPPTLSSCPDPTAHYVLLVTDQYLRLYTAGNVVAAERSTVAKRSPAAQQQLVYARPIQAGGAPGVMALAAAEHGLCVQVYGIPSLELIHEMPLSASLSWYWDVPPGHERRLGRMAATSRMGHLLLLGLSNELLELGLAAGLQPPAPPRLLFDQAAATSALAAAAKYEEEHYANFGRLARGSSLQPQQIDQDTPGSAHAGESGTSDAMEGVDSPVMRTEGRRVEKPAAKVAGAANVTLTRVFNKVQWGLTRAVEETTKGVKQLATNVERGVATVGAALIDGGASMTGGGAPGGPSRAGGSGLAHHSAEWYASLPDLGAVFSRTVPEDDATIARMRRKQARREAAARSSPNDDEAAVQEDDDDDDSVSILSISDDDDSDDDGVRTARRQPAVSAAPRAAAAAAAPPPLPSRRSAQPAVRSAGGGGAGDEESMRNELFGNARPYTTGGATPAGPRVTAASAVGGISNPRARTAEEIKRAYGRAPAEGGRAGAATARSNEVRAVMEQNRSKLEERGEKIRQLNDKAADLENSAAGFAEMARQLAERERNKKWWQL